MSERWLWTQKQDIGPSPRLAPALGYDPKGKRVVLFGGYVGEGRSQTGDSATWEWDGAAWVQVADMGPPGRGQGAMAYDATNECFVLFGGSPGLGDTWIWDGSEWNQVGDMGPQPRISHDMVFDRTRRRVVLYGGSAGNTTFNDTWEWDGTEWQQIADTGPPRSEHTLVFDEKHNSLILFGGWAPGGMATKDTWEFADSRWVQRQDIGPKAMATPKAVSTGTRIVLFGGGGRDQAGETWEWNGTLWTERQNMGPPSRFLHEMAYDRDRQRIVLFGGQSNRSGADTPLGDTWELTILS